MNYAKNAFMEMRFRRKFEAAHRFVAGENAGTLCSQPHGHTWFVTVTLGYRTPKNLNGFTNTLLPFEVAKKKWHEWIDKHVDHCFMYNSQDPLLEFMLKENPKGRHLVVQGDPTTEVIAATFKSKFQTFLNEIDTNLVCTNIIIDETQTNSISFSGNPAEHLPSGTFWWNRADFSTNDL